MSAILPAIRSALQPAIRAAISGVYGSSSAWSPLTLFAASEVGVWYDPSDFSTMFQDSAGTTPVTAVGDPVGKILDKSGNLKHATQATAASRPILRNDGTNYYLEFDGVDDSLATAAIDFSATVDGSFFAGFRKNSDSNTKVIVETSTSYSGGGFIVTAPDSTAANYGFAMRAIEGNVSRVSTTFTAPVTNVLSCNFVGAPTSSALKILPRINGVVPTLTTPAGTFTQKVFQNAPLYIGSRAGTTFFANGRIYSLTVLGRTATALEIAAAEAYVAGKSGVTL